ncbi:MAG: ScyD/ScyE family protein [Chloroflexales bacterium]|nr:ScyD/ScyE family protein [Chloroflexales bacterium]
MVERKRPLLGALALIVVVALVSWAAPAAARSSHQEAALQVVASGLNNPRGLAFTTSGDDLLVAEAGTGGSSPCFEGPEGQACLGNTGAIARVDLGSGAVERLVTGLPSLSLANPPGFNATGPHDVAAIDDTQFYVAMGLGGTPAVREALGSGAALLGHVVRVRPGGAPQAVADLAAFEVANMVSSPARGRSSGSGAKALLTARSSVSGPALQAWGPVCLCSWTGANRCPRRGHALTERPTT